ncbi:HlyD family efflux transporter periplasmic adaptor subunit [Ottowia testudinis]|uniref:HlyD family efflux transporter periplasmic adaptor subunit n=1 Tax=Ottowia testudinis TaxID=2816950 RepID=A0A975CKJ7_9BURK|nr:HlyD family efflux transporter periplasmic adaptor subunit [Ottowia testudinis]
MATLAAAAVLAGCGEPPAAGWSGYAEGEHLYVAAPVAGRLRQLAVRAGDTVAAGAPLFALDGQPERDATAAAQAQLDAAQAQAANLQTGRRPDEIAQIAAQLAQAEAQAALTQADAQRKQALVASGAVTRSEADAARTAAEQGRQRVGELQAALRSARQPAREHERAAARAQARAAESALAQQRWREGQTAQPAPAAGQVTDTYFRPGEWVGAGQPVVALLPPDRIKALFFVPEPALAGLRPGQRVQLACDGCGAPIAARITHMASEAEYTPPVIYSNAQRAKLVFRVEAQPEAADAARLKPGLPLDVRPAPGS